MGKHENIEIKEKKDLNLKGKIKMIGNITIESAKVQMEHPMTYVSVLGVAFAQSLITQGDFKSGAKAGFGAYGSIIGINIVYNIVGNMEAIIHE